MPFPALTSWHFRCSQNTIPVVLAIEMLFEKRELSLYYFLLKVQHQMFKSGPTQGSEAGAAHAILRPPGENCLRPEDEASGGEKQGESGVLVGSAERLHQG